MISGQKFGVDNLNCVQRKDLADKTTVKPSDRFQRITTALPNVFKYSENKTMKSIGMEIGKEFIKTISRVLEPPKITSSRKNKKIIPRSGS